MNDFHADYVNAPLIQRWRGGPLNGCFAMLTTQLIVTEPGKWVSRVLPGGAWVSMKEDEQGMRTLRIARRDAFKTDGGARLWTEELRTFLRIFGVTHWRREDEEREVGVSALFHEVAVQVDAFAGDHAQPDLFGS